MSPWRKALLRLVVEDANFVQQPRQVINTIVVSFATELRESK